MTRVRELTLKLLDGPLADADGAELDALLADAAALDEHLALLELEAALRGLRTDFDLAVPVLAAIQHHHADRTAAAVMADLAVRPAPPWARPRRRWYSVGIAATIAAAVLLGVWLGRPGTQPAPSPDVPAAFALLTRFSGDVELIGAGGRAIPVQAGTRFEPGAAVRTIGDDSVAVVELADHTRVELEPDTLVTFNADGPRVVLSQGQLRAEVPARTGEPMVVRTPGADVVSRGGSFLVSSAGWDSVRVEPWLGSVQLIRADAPQLAVEAGRAGVGRAGPDPLQLEVSAPVQTVPRRTLAYEAFPGMLTAVYAPDGRDVVAATAKRLVRWTADGGTADAEFTPRKGSDGLVARFSPDGSALVTQRAALDESLAVRAAPEWDVRVTIPARVNEPRFVTVAPAAAWVATALPFPTRNGFAVWDGHTGALRFTRAVDDDVFCLAASPDGRVVAVGVADLGRGVNNKVVFFDAATGERLFALPTQRKVVNALAFTADGRYLAAAFNGHVQLWDVRARELVRSVGGFERVPSCLAFAPDGRLAAGMGDGQVWVWPADLGPGVQRLQAGNRGVRSVHFAPDGRSLVVATNKAAVTVWDISQ